MSSFPIFSPTLVCYRHALLLPVCLPLLSLPYWNLPTSLFSLPVSAPAGPSAQRPSPTLQADAPLPTRCPVKLSDVCQSDS